MNVYTWRIVSTTIWTLQVKKYHSFLILLSKIAEIHVWNKLKLYKMVPFSAQVLSAVKPNEQLF